MLACFGLTSYLSSPQQPREYKEKYSSFKQESVDDYDVYHYSQKDNRPAHRGEAKLKMTAKELVSVRSVLKELEITKSPFQDPTVKSNNCGMPYFPTK